MRDYSAAFVRIYIYIYIYIYNVSVCYQKYLPVQSISKWYFKGVESIWCQWLEMFYIFIFVNFYNHPDVVYFLFQIFPKMALKF